MTANPNAPETNKATATFNSKEVPPLPVPTNRSAAALRSLMQDWERGEGVVDEEESETELMVLLCGMVSVSDATLSDA